MSASPVVAEGAIPLRDAFEEEPSPAALTRLKAPIDGIAAIDPASRKVALEALLRQHQLAREAPPLRGEDQLSRLLASGLPEIDRLLSGGLPRGQLSECFGPASSGRTGLSLAFVARATRDGALAAWVDPGDRFDPVSAAGAGVDLERFLWLRGGGSGSPDREPPRLADALSAVGVLVGSGLFDLVVLDLASQPSAELRRLPAALWVRLSRSVEPTSSSVLLLGREHLAKTSAGAGLSLVPSSPHWSGTGPGRMLRGLVSTATGSRGGRDRSISLGLHTA